MISEFVPLLNAGLALGERALGWIRLYQEIEQAEEITPDLIEKARKARKEAEALLAQTP